MHKRNSNIGLIYSKQPKIGSCSMGRTPTRPIMSSRRPITGVMGVFLLVEMPVDWVIE
jgi:hypothetical protein